MYVLSLQTPSTKVIILTTADLAHQKQFLLTLAEKQILDAVTVNYVLENAQFLIYLPYNSVEFQIVTNPNSAQQIFFPKTKNLNGQPLKIVQFDDYPYTRVTNNGHLGVFGENTYLFAIIAQQLNATVQVEAVEAPPQPSWKAALGKPDIYLHTEEITRKGLALHSEVFTYPFEIEYTHLVVARRNDSMITFLMLFINTQAILFYATVTLFFVLAWRVSCLSRRRTLLQRCFRIMMLSSLPRFMPRNRANHYLLLLSMFCLIYVTILQSQFTSCLISPNEPQINSVRELIDHEYTVYLHEDTDFPMAEYKHEIERYGETKLGSLKVRTLKIFFEEHPNVAILMWRSTFKLHWHLYRNEMHLVGEPIKQSLVAYKMTVNSPFYDFINELSIRVFEAGLRQYMRNSVKTVTNVRDSARHQKETRSVQLTTFKLRVALCVYGVGLLLATVVLLLELLWYRRRKWKYTWRRQKRRLRRLWMRKCRCRRRRLQPAVKRIFVEEKRTQEEEEAVVYLK